MREIEVRTPGGSYPITVQWGSLAFLGERVASVLSPCRAVLLPAANVWDAHGSEVEASLSNAGFDLKVIVRPPGEAQKSLNVAAEIYDELVDARLDRKSGLIAFGGGVIGDLGGFVAATFMRGIPYVQAPTTLLAQVDSSVGGKVAVNHPQAKNLIGAFYQPAGVIIDPGMLLTLPEKDYVAGLAEVVKYGIISDADFFRYLCSNWQILLAREDRSVLEYIISVSCEIKADVVSKDEKESGLRTILNYGHTIGHALEAGKGYGHFRHGEVVSIGMVAAARLSERLGLAEKGLVQEHEEMLKSLGLPVECRITQPDEIIERMYHDKKTVGGQLRFVLATRIGEVVISEQVTDNLARDVLLEMGNSDGGG